MYIYYAYVYILCILLYNKHDYYIHIIHMYIEYIGYYMLHIYYIEIMYYIERYMKNNIGIVNL